MKKIFWISLFIPYDHVSHAGGQIHNYYLKALHKSGVADIRLLTFATEDDMKEQDLDDYGINYKAICYGGGMLNKLGRGLINAESMLNPFNRYGRLLQNYHVLKIRKCLRRYAEEGYKPDIVILQWTQMLFFEDLIKKYFPNSYIIAVEEDVSYLSYRRKVDYYKNPILRYANKVSYQKVKKLELKCLEDADFVILNNHKDKNLVLSDGIEVDKLWIWTPFFQDYLNVPYHCTTYNVVFYGNMSRKENYLSAIWFVEHVMPLLADTAVEFHVIGANPHISLLKHQSDRVHIEGFVEHTEHFFSKSLCMVAPLVLGAGIKIKVLEAMAAGIPVLTNKIGIEGIGAKNTREYFCCEKPEEYADTIRKLISDPKLGAFISRNEKEFIIKNYDIKESAYRFIQYIEML